jgi:DNA-binding response OmpR family regulator
VNILFIHDDPEIQEEIREFLTVPNGNVYFSKDISEVIRILNDQSIELVVLNIKSMRDAGILKFINNNYKDLEVLVLASKEYDEIISVFSTGRYKLFRQPLKLSELKNNIEKILTH